MVESIIENFLEEHSIPFVLHTHEAVFTCEDAEKHCLHVPGIACKNLFLRDKKTKNFYLVILPASKRARISDLAEKLGFKKLTFAREEELVDVLQLKPGSVSVLGLLNDKENKTVLIVDQDIWNAPVLSFHPNVNTASLEFTQESFHKLVRILRPDFTLVSL